MCGFDMNEHSLVSEGYPVPAAKQPRRDDYNNNHDNQGGQQGWTITAGASGAIMGSTESRSCWTPRRSASKLVPRTTGQ
jgi:hypothetical protein